MVRRLYRDIDAGPREDGGLDDEVDLDPAHHARPDELDVVRLQGGAEEAEVEAELDEGGRDEDRGGEGEVGAVCQAA